MKEAEFRVCVWFLMLIELCGNDKMQKKETGEERVPLKNVKGMLFYVSLYVVPCNHRLHRQSNPGQRHDIRRISGVSLLRVFANCVNSLPMISQIHSG
jgi:hypothetical protein